MVLRLIRKLLVRCEGPWCRLGVCVFGLMLMIISCAEFCRYYEAPLESLAIRKAEIESNIITDVLVNRLFRYYYLPQTQVRPDCRDCARNARHPLYGCPPPSNLTGGGLGAKVTWESWMNGSSPVPRPCTSPSSPLPSSSSPGGNTSKIPAEKKKNKSGPNDVTGGGECYLACGLRLPTVAEVESCRVIQVRASDDLEAVRYAVNPTLFDESCLKNNTRCPNCNRLADKIRDMEFLVHGTTVAGAAMGASSSQSNATADAAGARYLQLAELYVHYKARQESTVPEPEWTRSGSIFFAFTTLAAIGFGSPSPVTSQSKFVITILAIPGIAIFGLCLSQLAYILVELIDLVRRELSLRFGFKRYRSSKTKSATDSVVDWPTVVMRFDVDKNGSLSLEEVINAGREIRYMLYGGGESGHAAVELLSKESVKRFERLLRRRFFDADIDGSGSLDYAEAVVLLYRLARDREDAEIYERALNDASISALLILPLCVFGALLFQNLEGSGSVYSTLDSFYFFVISVTTIGYGDIVPLSDWSRVVFVLNMMISLGLVTTIIRAMITILSYQPPPEPVMFEEEVVASDDEKEEYLDQALRMTKRKNASPFSGPMRNLFGISSFLGRQTSTIKAEDDGFVGNSSPARFATFAKSLTEMIGMGGTKHPSSGGGGVGSRNRVGVAVDDGHWAVSSPPSDGQSSSAWMKVNGGEHSSPGPDAAGVAMHDEHTGLKIQWVHITYSIKLRNRTVKRILNNVTGEARPAELMYIMGPSGSGKSTALDCIAGRVSPLSRNLSGLSGHVLVDGERIDANLFRMISKYVQADDTFIPVLSVAETLTYSARFYKNDDAVSSRVETVINMLGLQRRRNTMVGNAIIRGLSGGEKRRLSVGNELMANPRILFMDEVTSGLDSKAAYQVMQSLHGIAKGPQKTTLIVTIHQPAEQLFRLSSQLMILSKGLVAYCGPSDFAVSFFSSLGYPVPAMTSSSEYILNLVNDDFDDSGEATATATRRVSYICDEWIKSKLSVDGYVRIQSTKVPEIPLRVRMGLSAATSFQASSFGNQLKVLTRRVFLNTLRNPLVIWMRIVMYVVLALMVGTVWLNIGDGADVIVDIIGVIFFVAAFMVFMSVSVLPAYLEEKAVFVKERASGAYTPLVFMLAHTVVDIPFMLLQTMMSGTLVYFLVGLNPSGDRILFFFVDLFLSFMVAESIMLLVAALVPVAILGIAVGGMIFGAFMVVQGFFIKVENINWYWRWMRWIGLHTYSFSAFMHNEFSGRVFRAVPDASGGSIEARTGESVLEAYQFENVDKWTCMGVLVVMTFLYRLIAALVMYYNHTGKR